MDKYIVEIEGKNTCTYPDGEKCLAFHVESDSGKAVMCTKIPLTPYNEPDMEQVRKEAYDKGYTDAAYNCHESCAFLDDAKKEAYQRGLNDAREGKASCQFCEYEMCSDRADPCRICACNYMNFFEPKKQEKEEQIQVGDEVTPRETEYDDMIVTRLWKDDYDSDCIDAIGFDGRICSFLVSRVSKTGKHYEIAEVLQKMKEA